MRAGFVFAAMMLGLGIHAVGPDNFYGVEQSVVTAKGNMALLGFIDGVLDEARRSGLIARSIEEAGLIGVDVPSPAKR
jgi:hypothetical protein